MQAILNWLWQGCLVVSAAALLFGRARRMSATTRYTLWWATLGAVLLLPLLPLLADAAAPDLPPAADAAALPPFLLPRGAGWLGAAVASVWAAWTIFAVCQSAAGLFGLRRARRTGVPLPEGREDRLRHWSSVRHTGRRARLIASSDVRVAAVLGLGAPTIAVAPDILDVLDDEALDHVLLHEWAHVQRRDDVTRVCQVVVRALAGLHPAIWWIGRRMDIEREVACDDRVVQITGGARRYAACLTQVAAAAPGREAVMFAPGVLRHSQLRERVRRLLDGRRNASTTRSAFSLATVLPMLMLVTLTSASVELIGTAPAIARALEARERAVKTVIAGGAPAAERSGGAEPSSDEPTVYGLVRARPRDVAPVQDGARRVDQAPVRTGASTQTARRPESDESLLPDRQASLTAALSSRMVHTVTPALAPATTSSMPRDPQTDEAARVETRAETPSPWNTAARAGIAVGHGSQKAALATAGFFTNATRRLANSF